MTASVLRRTSAPRGPLRRGQVKGRRTRLARPVRHGILERRDPGRDRVPPGGDVRHGGGRRPEHRPV